MIRRNGNGQTGTTALAAREAWGRSQAFEDVPVWADPWYEWCRDSVFGVGLKLVQEVRP